MKLPDLQVLVETEDSRPTGVGTAHKRNEFRAPASHLCVTNNAMFHCIM